MLIEIDDEALDTAIVNSLRAQILMCESDLREIEATGEGVGNYSWDYTEDKEEISEILIHLQKVFELYGGNLDNIFKDI